MDKKIKIPDWIKKRVYVSENYYFVKNLLEKYEINTVCKSAVCPNIYECFSKKYVSFMILGNTCTRNCKFCGVEKGKGEKIDKKEPDKIAEIVEKLDMKYVVITSVTRDDLPDGGAGHFAKVVKKIKERSKKTIVEVLIPDFCGKKENLEILFKSEPDVISHNLDTTPSLFPEIRPSSNYDVSLSVLKEIKKNGFISKSSFMLGLGEKKEDIFKLMDDLRKAGCDYLVIGQYLSPDKNSYPVKEFIHPDFFREIEEKGKEMGFKNVFAGTFYRSSYLAEKLLSEDQVLGLTEANKKS